MTLARCGGRTCVGHDEAGAHDVLEQGAVQRRAEAATAGRHPSVRLAEPGGEPAGQAEGVAHQLEIGARVIECVGITEPGAGQGASADGNGQRDRADLGRLQHDGALRVRGTVCRQAGQGAMPGTAWGDEQVMQAIAYRPM
jgi:hypothetical protein